MYSRYKDQKIRVEMPPADDGYFKRQEHRLFYALGGDWSRRRGYHISPNRAAIWRAMVAAGWDAGHKGITEPSRMFDDPNGECVSLREALRRVKQPSQVTAEPRNEPANGGENRE